MTATANQIIATFDALDRADRGRNQVRLSALRAALPGLSRDEVDSGVNELRRARTMTLEASDGRHERLTEADRSAAIIEGGESLVYIARRIDD